MSMLTCIENSSIDPSMHSVCSLPKRKALGKMRLPLRPALDFLGMHERSHNPLQISARFYERREQRRRQRKIKAGFGCSSPPHIPLSP